MKKKIVIASILKPVDDVRAYWKLSQSIAKTNKYEVNIIGNGPKKEIGDKNINVHSHLIHRKQWFKRIITRLKILLKILRLRPSVLIITTHELLLNALITNLLTRCKIIYDVQENYARNLSSINSTIFKRFYASLVRIKEHLTRRFIDEFWLAEACYKNELTFVRKKYTIVENKAFFYPIPERTKEPIQMLFSGTISDYSGIDNALKLYHSILLHLPESTFHIIGQVHDNDLHSKLKSEAHKHRNISLNISKYPIPHGEILQAITTANLGVISYIPNDINKDKIPTKLYEYSRYKLPYVVQKNSNWSVVGNQLGGAIPVDFLNLDTQSIINTLRDPDNLFPNQYPEETTWEHEADKIIYSLNNLTD